MDKAPHPHLPSDCVSGDPGETVTRSLEMGTRVTVTLPREVNVNLVEVQSLQEYEVWTWVTSLLLSPVTGYFVAYSQSGDIRLLVNACVFGLIFIIALGRTVYTRWRLTKGGRKSGCDGPPRPDNPATVSRCLAGQTASRPSASHPPESPSRTQDCPPAPDRLGLPF
jgi:hypothetical protein